MHPSVAQAMADSAGAFVNLWDLQDAVGARLAELTNNEAAYVSNGAAAGLALATAACITGTDLALMARLPSKLNGLKNEVVVHRTQRNWYDIAVRQTGVTLVEIGHIMETFPWELDDAINERTAAVLYFAGTHLNRNTLPLEYVIERAHARDVPVIVDAAAQVPPVENLWHFTRDLGADIAIFSGGKNLAGPQNSGLVVGRKAIIEAMKLNGPPHQRIGRSMKVSKEAMIGLLTAVERYLSQDHAALEAEWDRVVNSWLSAWQAIEQNGATVVRDDFNEAGEHIPRVIVSLTPRAGIDRAKLLALLTDDDPPIEVVLHDDRSVAFSPHLLQSGEAEIVERRVAAILAGLRTPAGAAV
jgi:L-seryl-tRNA(Ser) seleniumtransferase